MSKNKKIYFVLFIGLLLINGELAAQIIINGKNKPDSSWMTKEIPAKKLAAKKYTFSRSLYQNLVTRFNYYYNAHTKLARILERAEDHHKDNYDSLLSFFPYTLQDFHPMKNDLDSVILDAGIGIEIHDPRSKWIDNLYMLAGKGYYFKEDYENAIDAFKYIIKHEGPKNEGGQPEVIGSREYTSQKAISIVTPEEKKLFYHTPSRNDAYIWLIRSYIATGKMDLASSLMNTLSSDPHLPERLKAPLAAMEAWYALKQQNDQKSLAALEKAISLQEEKHLKTRWEFIISQLYDQNKDWEQAFQHYKRVTKLPAGPLMDFYAHLNMMRILILKDKQSFKTGSELLLNMAKREKYARYRDIIYFNLGKLALQAGFPNEAVNYLKQSLVFNRTPNTQQLASFKLLADIYYDHLNYRQAKAYYDSAAAIATPNINFYDTLTVRTNGLAGVVKNLDIINRQDSLLYLASLPKEQLTAFLEQIVQDSLKARRKRNRFLKSAPQENELLANPEATNIPNNEAGQDENTAWYFYNTTFRAKGFSAFKSEWGKRPLTDNWRLSNANQKTADLPAQSANPFTPDSSQNLIAGEEEEGIKKLMANIPLSLPQKKTANDSIIRALFNNATIFYDRLNNDPATLQTLDTLLSRYPQNEHLPEIYYRLYLLYAREGNQAKAGYYRQLLDQNFATSKFAQALHPQPEITKTATALLTARLYDSAYINYLAGNYQRTLLFKDSAMHINPANEEGSRFDLLGAMTMLKTASDSAGKVALNQVISRNSADTAIVSQAEAILNALNHKQELVEHLAHLQLPEQQEEKPAPVITNQNNIPKPKENNPVPEKPVMQEKAKPSPEKAIAKKDTVAIQSPPKPETPYKAESQIPYFVVLSFNRTDKEMIDEGLNKFAAYNQKQHPGGDIEVSSYLLANNHVILIFRLFPNESAALTYYKEIRQKASQIIPGIPPSYYRLFIISRSNFILLNNTQDYEGYLKFFSKFYR